MPDDQTIRDPESKHSRDFERVIVWASAISMAAAAAFMASLKQVHPVVEFRFSFGTVAAFFGAGLLTIVFFRAFLRKTQASGAGQAAQYRRWLILFGVMTVLAMLTTMAVAVKNISYEKRMDVIIGASIAIAVLTFFGWIIVRLIRFLEADSRE